MFVDCVQKLSKHQADAPNKSREWHYIRVVAESGDQFLNTSGWVSQAKSVIKTHEIGLGTRAGPSEHAVEHLHDRALLGFRQSGKPL